MIMRALDINGDWTFGRGKNNFKRGNDAVAESIQTRLMSFKYDCFFDQSAGVDWFTFLGGKNIVGLRLAIGSVILGTPNVTGVNQLSINIDSLRRITISYSVTTAITASSSAQLVTQSTSFLLTESGSILTDESGGALQAG